MGVFLLLVSLFSMLGFFLTLFSFFGWLSPFFLYCVFLLLCAGGLVFVYKFILFIPKVSKVERKILYALLSIWFLHFLQVLVPETGFDAIWYHLPVIKEILLAGKIVYIPELYQTMNPLFADLYFMVGYFVAGTVGAKAVAFLFGVLLVSASYYVSRFFLRRDLSLLVACTVSLFQVVAWQSSSVYVDVAKAFFELSGVLAVLYASKNSLKYVVVAAFLFSASLATKMFSIFLLPLFVWILFSSWKSSGLRVASVGVLLVALCAYVLPYYLGAWTYTGNPVFSLVVPLSILGEIGGSSSVVNYLLSRIGSSPFFFIRLLFSRDYIAPFSVVFMVPILYRLRDITRDSTLTLLAVFSIYQLGIWWLVPPFSTRYALSGFITLFLLGVIIVDRYFVHTKQQRKLFIVALSVQIGVLLLPRLFVAARSLQYLVGNQTQTEYLQQFYDGTIDDKIDAWYFPQK